MSAPLVLVYPLLIEVLSPLMVNPLMVTLLAATWKISPELIADADGTTMASATLDPEHGLIDAFGPVIVRDLLTITFSAYVPASTVMVWPFRVAAAFIAA